MFFYFSATLKNVKKKRRKQIRLWLYYVCVWLGVKFNNIKNNFILFFCLDESEFYYQKKMWHYKRKKSLPRHDIISQCNLNQIFWVVFLQRIQQMDSLFYQLSTYTLYKWIYINIVDIKSVENGSNSIRIFNWIFIKNVIQLHRCIGIS